MLEKIKEEQVNKINLFNLKQGVILRKKKFLKKKINRRNHNQDQARIRKMKTINLNRFLFNSFQRLPLNHRMVTFRIKQNQNQSKIYFDYGKSEYN